MKLDSVTGWIILCQRVFECLEKPCLYSDDCYSNRSPHLLLMRYANDSDYLKKVMLNNQYLKMLVHSLQIELS